LKLQTKDVTPKAICTGSTYRLSEVVSRDDMLFGRRRSAPSRVGGGVTPVGVLGLLRLLDLPETTEDIQFLSRLVQRETLR
jgi:hypothetical protein